MRARLILVSSLESVSRPFLKLGMNRIPGARFFYHLLNELIWLWPTSSIREIEGSRMYLNPHEKEPMRTAFRSFIRAYGKEPLTTRIFKRVVKDGFTVVDIGANIGYFTLLAARLVGKNGRVYAFEPSPQNYGVLSKNVALNGYQNVVALQKAVFNTSGMVKLYLSKTDVGAHTLRQQHAHPQFDTSQFGEFTEVESVTLDGFFKGKQQPIDVIKMDMEGSEMAALLGMDRLIRENKNLKMFIEFYPSAIREMGYSPEEFIRTLLEKYGFTITVVDELRTTSAKLVKVSSVAEVMNLCQDEERIVNLFLER